MCVCFCVPSMQSVAIGAGPYFYLPKMESHLEARLWNDAFNLAQVQSSHQNCKMMSSCSL